MGDDITVTILREIRDELRAQGNRLDTGLSALRTEMAESIAEIHSDLVAVRHDLSTQGLALNRLTKEIREYRSAAWVDIDARVRSLEDQIKGAR